MERVITVGKHRSGRASTSQAAGARIENRPAAFRIRVPGRSGPAARMIRRLSQAEPAGPASLHRLEQPGVMEEGLGKIVITEFMTRSGVDDLAGDFAVTYDPELYRDERRPGGARALTVRNNTRPGNRLLWAARDGFEEEPPGAGLTGKSGERVAASTMAQVREVLRSG